MNQSQNLVASVGDLPLRNQDGNEFTLSGALIPSLKWVGFYFSMHSCPPCREFTPILAELYKETNVSFASQSI